MNGRYPDAGKLLDRIPEPLRQPLLGPLYAEILFQTKQVDAAIKQAKAATVADPTNAQSQYWYSQLLARSAQDPKLPEARRKEIMAQATQAMQKATQLQPEFAEAWFALINYLLMQDKENEAQKAMRDAQLAMSGDNLAMFLARSYESLHRWFDAETMYREIYETKPDDLQRAAAIGRLLHGPPVPTPRPEGKSHAAYQPTSQSGRRRQAARQRQQSTLGSPNGRQNARIHPRLSEFAQGRQFARLQFAGRQFADRRQTCAMAEILAPRPEPISRKKAIGLLEEVDAGSTPQRICRNPTRRIVLLPLGSEWSKYESEMEKVISRYPNSARARESYARKLLTRGDPASIDRAARLVGELQKIAPNYPATFELTVRIADKRGQQKQVAEALRRRLPNLDDPKELDRRNETNRGHDRQFARGLKGSTMAPRKSTARWPLATPSRSLNWQSSSACTARPSNASRS